MWYRGARLGEAWEIDPELRPSHLRRPGRPRMFAGGAALACLLFGGGCSGGRVDGSGYEPLLPLTLSWDQPDMRADYYQVKAGPVMVRAEQPIVRLQLPSGSYRVEIESCNAAGCSPPTTVEV